MPSAAPLPAGFLPAGFLPAVVEVLALGRAAVGVTMLSVPRLVPGVLGADPAASSALSWLVQMLGARELALGLGAALAGRSGDSSAARHWLAAGLICDAVDAVAVAAAVGSGRLARGAGGAVVAVAAGAVAVQAAELARR